MMFDPGAADACPLPSGMHPSRPDTVTEVVSPQAAEGKAYAVEYHPREDGDESIVCVDVSDGRPMPF